MSKQEDFPDRKSSRRDKITKNKHSRNRFDYDDDDIRKNKVKKEIKKIKESYDNEEWEDWDNYYNR